MARSYDEKRRMLESFKRLLDSGVRPEQASREVGQGVRWQVGLYLVAPWFPEEFREEWYKSNLLEGGINKIGPLLRRGKKEDARRIFERSVNRRRGRSPAQDQGAKLVAQLTENLRRLGTSLIEEIAQVVDGYLRISPKGRKKIVDAIRRFEDRETSADPQS